QQHLQDHPASVLRRVTHPASLGRCLRKRRTVHSECVLAANSGPHVTATGLNLSLFFLFLPVSASHRGTTSPRPCCAGAPVPFLRIDCDRSRGRTPDARSRAPSSNSAPP